MDQITMWSSMQRHGLHTMRAASIAGLLLIAIMLTVPCTTAIKLTIPRHATQKFTLPEKYYECDSPPFGVFVLDVSAANYSFVGDILRQRGWTERQVTDAPLYDLKWTYSFSRAKVILPCQMVNHFPDAEYTIGSKSGLQRILDAADPTHDIHPQTWNLADGAVSLVPGFYVSKRSDANRGVGIEVFYLHKEHVFPQESNRVLQQYIARPHVLSDRKKYDMRIFAVVSSLQPLVAYLSTDFYIRQCAHEYELATPESPMSESELSEEHDEAHGAPLTEIRDIYAHLTNKQISKQVSNDTLQLSAEQYIDAIGRDVYDTVVRPQVIAAVTKTLRGWSDMHGEHDHRMRSFELLGFDILLDENLKVWVVEANVSPGLHLNSPVVRKHHPQLVRDMFSVLFDHESTCVPRVGVLDNIVCDLPPVVAETTVSAVEDQKEDL